MPGAHLFTPPHQPGSRSRAGINTEQPLRSLLPPKAACVLMEGVHTGGGRGALTRLRRRHHRPQGGARPRPLPLPPFRPAPGMPCAPRAFTGAGGVTRAEPIASAGLAQRSRLLAPPRGAFEKVLRCAGALSSSGGRVWPSPAQPSPAWRETPEPRGRRPVCGESEVSGARGDGGAGPRQGSDCELSPGSQTDGAGGRLRYLGWAAGGEPGAAAAQPPSGVGAVSSFSSSRVKWHRRAVVQHLCHPV